MCPVTKRSQRTANRNLVFHAIVEIHLNRVLGQLVRIDGYSPMEHV